MIALKLGGSVITTKDTPDTLDEGALSQAAQAIAAGPEDIVLVHGAGSFGHHYAAKHDVSRSTGTHDPAAGFAIHDAMRRLNDAVIAALHGVGVPGLPIHPLSTGARNKAGELTLGMAAIRRVRAEGFVPVLHGDVIAHEDNGLTIISGDEVITEVATRLDADRVGLCTGVPGVLDGSGTVIPEITDFDAVADVLGESDTTDVTGGMAAKVQELHALEMPAWIFNLTGLGAFLNGDSPGTRID